MREIKFRGFRTYKKEWVYGFYIVRHSMSEILQPSGTVPVEPESVGQFTGFKDQNGKEIYEGDKISDWVEVDGKQEQSKQTVFWHESEGQWMLDNSFSQDRSHFFSLASELRDFEYEIIGNIYENPELCK